ncbi:MAG: hypothetical protein HYU99_08305 [Deltaproteobacteria bacterium]|nr:hypothetical protein [Deltaproteobacteria bacterium]
MKALSIRLDDDLGRKFDAVCKQTGHKKNTVVSRLIQAFVLSRSHGKAVSSKKKRDPFLDVIGIANIESSISNEDIDKIV